MTVEAAAAPPSVPLAGRRALVIGGSSGIGLASAALLAADGAAVTIAGRDEARLAAAAESLAADGPAVATARCDALAGADVAAAVAAAAGGGALDMVVVVPGGGRMTRVLDYEDEAFGADVDRNVRPVFLALKYGAAAMSHGGSVVAVSSTAAAFSSRYLAAYCAGKAAVDMLVTVAADELGERGIRVNSVRPGLTRTGATGRMVDDPEVVGRFLAGQPLARPGEAVDIARAVRFLAGPESGWVTGQHLAVDGGHTLRSFPDLRDLLPPAGGGAPIT